MQDNDPTILTWSNSQEAQSWVREVLPRLKRPCVVCLAGPMGAGKTQVVRWFLQEMQGSEVCSPTFAIHQQYLTPGGPVDHIDLYRLQSDQELESIGFWDLLREERALVFVEWSDRLPQEVWPPTWTQLILNIQPGQGGQRTVNFLCRAGGTRS